MRLRANYAKASCEACGGFVRSHRMVWSKARHGLLGGKAWFEGGVLLVQECRKAIN